MATTNTTVRMLGLEENSDTETKEKANSNTKTWIVAMAILATGGIDIMIEPLTLDYVPCQHAWVLVLTRIGNLDQTNMVEVS